MTELDAWNARMLAAGARLAAAKSRITELETQLGASRSSGEPVFLHAGDLRVWCVGCTRWCANEGYCEGDPDICPIGEEDQGRSPTLDEAQQAIDALHRELVELDELGASRSGGIPRSLSEEPAK